LTDLTRLLTKDKPKTTRQDIANNVKPGAWFKGPPKARVSILAQAIQYALC